MSYLTIMRCLIIIVVSSALGFSQLSSGGSAGFAGCYEVVSLTWKPPDDSIRSVPQRFRLIGDKDLANGDRAFEVTHFENHVRSERNRLEGRWGWWKPRNEKQIHIDFSGGLAGFRGTLKFSKDGDLAGKIREWCDSRCEWKKRTGILRVRRVACPPT